MKYWTTCLAMFMSVGLAFAEPPATVSSDLPRFGFVGLNVHDLGKSVDFYTRSFGMKELLRIDAGEFIEVGLGYGDDPDQPRLVLVSRKTPGAHSDKDGALSRLAFYVPNVRGLVAKLTTEGVTVLRPPRALPQHNVTLAFIQDPEGVQIELIEKSAQ